MKTIIGLFGVVFYVAYFLVTIAVSGALVYAAFHFISKYW